MKNKRIIYGVVILWFLFGIGCYAPRKDRLKNNLGYEAVDKQLKQEQLELEKARKEQVKLLEKKKKVEKKLPVEPVIPTFNPLDEVPVSITVQNETLHNVLYVIARNAGLNLVIDPEISLQNRVTISFENTPSSLVLNKLLEAYDLAWEVKDNILYVKSYEERIFNLDFLNVDPTVSISSGGSISQGSTTTGSFSITGDVAGDKDTGIYDDLTKSIEDILKDTGGGGEVGYYTLNPVAGTLCVKTTPSRMKIIAKLVDDLKKKLRRQVVIDAQILEVNLSDGFNFGINWGFVQQRLIHGTENIYGIGWVAGQGFGTPGSSNANPGVPTAIVIGANPNGNLYTSGGAGFDSSIKEQTLFSTTIKALQTFGTVKIISNPHIRAKHGQPALVTCGTTKTYINQITKNVDDEGQVTYTPSTAEAFQGVMLGVVPFINDDGSIDLRIYPVTSEVFTDQRVTVGDNEMVLPTINVRNVDTSVRVHDGDTIILGGLIYKNSNKSDGRTPGLGSIPGLGWLFKNRDDSESVSELVIIMKIRVVS